MIGIDKKPTFREVLERNTNLLTVFSIFNALSIWSAQIEQEPVNTILPFFFICLSIITLWEVIRDTYSEQNHGFLHYIYSLLLVFSQIAMVYYIFNKYFNFIILIIYFLLFIILAFNIHRLMMYIVRRIPDVISSKKLISQFVFFLSIVNAMCLAAIADAYLFRLFKSLGFLQLS